MLELSIGYTTKPKEYASRTLEYYINTRVRATKCEWNQFSTPQIDVSIVHH